MADELIHKDPGTELAKAEFEATDLHVANNQARGDILISNAAGNGWIRLAKPSADAVLVMGADDPVWRLPDFAGIFFDENASALTINLQHSFEQVVDFDSDMPESVSNGRNATNDIVIGATGTYQVVFHISGTPAGTNKTYEWFAFEIAASGSTITGATQANPCVITAVAHGFSNGDRVKITGVAGMTELNGRIFTVANKADDTFELNEDNGGNINSGGFGAYTSGGTATLATILLAVHMHRKFATQDVGSMSGGGIVSLTLNKTLELWIKNITDATNITFDDCSFYMLRIK